MITPRLTRQIGILLVVIVAVVALGLSAARFLEPPSKAPAVAHTGQAAIGGPISLLDHRGRRVSEASYSGRHLLVFFGYTFCPDVCPTGLQTISTALDSLGASAEAVQPLFITVDPARDTVPVMADYVANFHPSLIGLTGTEPEVSAALKAYRVYAAKGPVDADGDYLMDHSAFMFLMAPDGSYLRHFGPQTTAEEMAAGLKEVL